MKLLLNTQLLKDFEAKIAGSTLAPFKKELISFIKVYYNIIILENISSSLSIPKNLSFGEFSALSEVIKVTANLVNQTSKKFAGIDKDLDKEQVKAYDLISKNPYYERLLKTFFPEGNFKGSWINPIRCDTAHPSNQLDHYNTNKEYLYNYYNLHSGLKGAATLIRSFFVGLGFNVKEIDGGEIEKVEEIKLTEGEIEALPNVKEILEKLSLSSQSSQSSRDNLFIAHAYFIAMEHFFQERSLVENSFELSAFYNSLFHSAVDAFNKFTATCSQEDFKKIKKVDIFKLLRLERNEIAHSREIDGTYFSETVKGYSEKLKNQCRSELYQDLENLSKELKKSFENIHKFELPKIEEVKGPEEGKEIISGGKVEKVGHIEEESQETKYNEKIELKENEIKELVRELDNLVSYQEKIQEGSISDPELRKNQEEFVQKLEDYSIYDSNFWLNKSFKSEHLNLFLGILASNPKSLYGLLTNLIKNGANLKLLNEKCGNILFPLVRSMHEINLNQEDLVIKNSLKNELVKCLQIILKNYPIEEVKNILNTEIDFRNDKSIACDFVTPEGVFKSFLKKGTITGVISYAPGVKELLQVILDYGGDVNLNVEYEIQLQGSNNNRSIKVNLLSYFMEFGYFDYGLMVLNNKNFDPAFYKELTFINSNKAERFKEFTFLDMVVCGFLKSSNISEKSQFLKIGKLLHEKEYKLFKLKDTLTLKNYYTIKSYQEENPLLNCGWLKEIAFKTLLNNPSELSKLLKNADLDDYQSAKGLTQLRKDILKKSRVFKEEKMKKKAAIIEKVEEAIKKEDFETVVKYIDDPNSCIDYSQFTVGDYKKMKGYDSLRLKIKEKQPNQLKEFKTVELKEKIFEHSPVTKEELRECQESNEKQDFSVLKLAILKQNMQAIDEWNTCGFPITPDEVSLAEMTKNEMIITFLKEHLTLGIIGDHV